MSSSKENILNRINKALETPTPVPFPDLQERKPLFHSNQDDLAVVFAEEFTKLGGKFAICKDDTDVMVQMRKLFSANSWSRIYCVEEQLLPIVRAVTLEPYPELASCEASVTSCECVIARTGSIMLSSALPQGRTASVYAPVHVCIAYMSQLHFDVEDALNFMQEKYGEKIPSFITLATGPSRTADIEKTLVTGVHGPKEVYCFLVADK